jgi:hypothetical protein
MYRAIIRHKVAKQKFSLTDLICSSTCMFVLRSRLRLLCGAVGDPPNILQPTEAYCTNPAFSPPPTYISRSAPHQTTREKELWARNGRSNLAYKCDFHCNCRVLLHAAKLRHGTNGFTSPPKEGMLRIFSPEKSDDFGWVRTRECGYQRPSANH